MDPDIIQIEQLTKNFGELRAVDNLTLSVQQGTIFGLIGANGAGKTTTVKLLTTLLRPTKGRVRIAGFDITEQSELVRRHIGYVPQEAHSDEALTGKEHLILQGKLYGLTSATISTRAKELLALVDLDKSADRRTLEYSGGMRKLLDVACGLIHQPRVLFVDEPTAGVDIHHRRKLLNYICTLPEKGTTVFLTSHLLEEIDQTANRVAIIDHGSLIIEGTPESLKQGVGKTVFDLSFAPAPDDVAQSTLVNEISQLEGVTQVVSNQGVVKVFSTNQDELLPIIRAKSEKLKVSINSLSISQPTLNDVFSFYVKGKGV